MPEPKKNFASELNMIQIKSLARMISDFINSMVEEESDELLEPFKVVVQVEKSEPSFIIYVSGEKRGHFSIMTENGKVFITQEIKSLPLGAFGLEDLCPRILLKSLLIDIYEPETPKEITPTFIGPKEPPVN